MVVAAEAFYLAEGTGAAKDRSEMRYRLSLRAAVWSDGTMPGWTREQIFRQMRSGYDVRSAVAHGGRPEQRDLKIQDVAVDLGNLGRFIQ